MRTFVATSLVLITLLMWGPVAAAAVGTSVVAEGLDHPWSMVFLPDGRALLTERTGSMHIMSLDGSLSAPLSGDMPPKGLETRGQAGLFGVALDPNFAANKRIYYAFAETENDAAGTAVASAVLDVTARTVTGTKVIFRQDKRPTNGGTAVNHFGGRLAFDTDGMLFITVAERFDYREEAQDPAGTMGKIIRIQSDGSPAPLEATSPRCNCDCRKGLAAAPKLNPLVWSYGHRNPQGAAIHPVTGELWTGEHGPKGGDELNIPVKGGNYGWPLVSFGSHYDGTEIPDTLPDRKDLLPPVHHWTPSIAIAGMTFYTGTGVYPPEWKHNLFVTALAGKQLVRLELNGKTIVKEEKLLQDLGKRLRDVVQGPDGYLYVLTDEGEGKGAVLKVTAGTPKP